MKVALYIEDGVEQIVLTPESPTERMVLDKIQTPDRVLTIFKGSFYECRGGWSRHGQADNDSSTIIRLTAPAAPE